MEGQHLRQPEKRPSYFTTQSKPRLDLPRAANFGPRCVVKIEAVIATSIDKTTFDKATETTWRSLGPEKRPLAPHHCGS